MLVFWLVLIVQFSDKLERMLDVLTVTAEQARNVEPVSAHPSKLREQIDETTVIVNAVTYTNSRRLDCCDV